MGGLRQWSERAASSCSEGDVTNFNVIGSKVMNVRLILASLYLTISSVEYSLDSVFQDKHYYLKYFCRRQSMIIYVGLLWMIGKKKMEIKLNVYRQSFSKCPYR